MPGVNRSISQQENLADQIRYAAICGNHIPAHQLCHGNVGNPAVMNTVSSVPTHMEMKGVHTQTQVKHI